MKAGDMRYRVDVMRPTEAQGSRGQTQGTPTLIKQAWPCSIKNLSGREAVQARTVFAEATYKVQGYGDPAIEFKERDFLTGGSIGNREFSIGSIDDELQNGILLSLLCGERTGG